jgi:hypothetical protein
LADIRLQLGKPGRDTSSEPFANPQLLPSPRANTFFAPLHKASSQFLFVFFTFDPTTQ